MYWVDKILNDLSILQLLSLYEYLPTYVLIAYNVIMSKCLKLYNMQYMHM